MTRLDEYPFAEFGFRRHHRTEAWGAAQATRGAKRAARARSSDRARAVRHLPSGCRAADVRGDTSHAGQRLRTYPGDLRLGGGVRQIHLSPVGVAARTNLQPPSL